VGADCCSRPHPWGAGAALALGKNWEVAKKPQKTTNPPETKEKTPWGNYFLQSPVVVEDRTDWNNFSERGKPHVNPRYCWMLLLDTGVPVN